MPPDGNTPAAPPGLTLEQQIFKKKADAFDKDLAALQEKHGLVLVPIIRFNQHGIMPDLIYMTKEEFNKKLQAGEAASTPPTDGPLAGKKI